MGFYDIKATYCSYPCQECGQRATEQAPNLLADLGHRAAVHCRQCLEGSINQANRVLGKKQYRLFIVEEAEQWGAPPAAYAEHPRGSIVHYRLGNQIVAGELLYIKESSQGFFYIVENAAQGFPDVVPAREILEKEGEQ